MKKLPPCKLLLTVLLALACATLHAQKNTKGVWKKQVSRELDMQIKENEKKHHLKDLSKDTTLLEILLNEIKAGKLAAYPNTDHPFTTKLTYSELYKILVPPPDTIEITDPVTGQELRKIVMHDLDYDAIHKYRILEDWTFNPATGNTDIHIEGIAPVKEIYVDGDFRGVQAMFWVRYSDVLPVLEKYEQIHPDNSLTVHIWEDYFYSDVKPKEATK